MLFIKWNMRRFWSSKWQGTLDTLDTYWFWLTIGIFYVFILNQMVQRSKHFLTNTREFLDNWVTLGHDSCHKTDGYNAEECHQDCKIKGKSDFAKQCKTDGGLYKCCIRSADNILFDQNCFSLICIVQTRQGVLPRVPVLLHPLCLHHSRRINISTH